MELTEIQQSLLKDLTDLHALPQGAFSVRVNGETLNQTPRAKLRLSHTKIKKALKLL